MLKSFIKIIAIAILLSSLIFALFLFVVSQYVDIFRDWLLVYFQSMPEILWFIYMFIFILCYMVVDMFLPS